MEKLISLSDLAKITKLTLGTLLKRAKAGKIKAIFLKDPQGRLSSKDILVPMPDISEIKTIETPRKPTRIPTNQDRKKGQNVLEEKFLAKIQKDEPKFTKEEYQVTKEKLKKAREELKKGNKSIPFEFLSVPMFKKFQRWENNEELKNQFPSFQGWLRSLRKQK